MPRCIPPQVTTAELVDGAVPDHALLRSNLRDMAQANRWLGANRAVLRRVAEWLAALPAEYVPSVLDVATGGAEIPLLLRRWSIRQGRPVRLLASDMSGDVLAVAQASVGRRPIRLIRHDALRMPCADSSVDLVICTQALHHFGGDDAAALLRELARVARHGVLVSDLARGYPAYWGARLLALGPVSTLSRHDGPLSVLRAYTPAECRALLRKAALPGQVHPARGFRIEIEIRPGSS